MSLTRRKRTLLEEQSDPRVTGSQEEQLVRQEHALQRCGSGNQRTSSHQRLPDLIKKKENKDEMKKEVDEQDEEQGVLERSSKSTGVKEWGHDCQ